MQPHILVLEDNSVDIMMLEFALEQTDSVYALECLQNGLEARSRIRDPQRPPPDLVLLDLNLPMIGGLCLLEEIRANEAWSQVPVIVWSSTCSPQDAAAAGRLGVVEVFIKPNDLEDWSKLGKRLHALLKPGELS